MTPLLRALIPPFVRALSGLKLGRPRSCRPAAASAGSGARQKQTDAVKRSPARRRIDAPGETPQLNLTLPWCAAAQQFPPRSLDPRFIPTSAVDRPTLTHAQPIDHSKNQDPKSRPPLCPHRFGYECRQRNAPRAFVVKSIVPILLMGTGPQPVGKGQSGLSDPNDPRFSDVLDNPTLPRSACGGPQLGRQIS